MHALYTFLYTFILYSLPFVNTIQSLHELNELRHTVQLRLFHQHIQERVNSLLLPILTTLPVNDKYAPLFPFVVIINCSL